MSMTQPYKTSFNLFDEFSVLAIGFILFYSERRFCLAFIKETTGIFLQIVTMIKNKEIQIFHERLSSPE